MKALIIIFAIILFFVLLLSVRFTAVIHYDEDVALDVRWLFIKKQIMPEVEPKKPKKKKEKKKKEPEPETVDETVKEPKKKGDNIITRFYRNNGIPGFIDLLKRLMKAVGGMFSRIFKSFIIDDLFISLIVGDSDSAQTAIKHGKTCAAVYPILGYLTTHMNIKKHKTEILPDFAQGRNIVRVHAKISVVPRKLINAVIIVAFELTGKVLFKLLKGSKAKKPATAEHLK
ncbi:MAG: DUF2953 domain-containing protein [Clostridia bacterium]|nr:DUF2953 domain-containing protein [Clostridia bacterium]